MPRRDYQIISKVDDNTLVLLHFNSLPFTNSGHSVVNVLNDQVTAYNGGKFGSNAVFSGVASGNTNNFGSLRLSGFNWASLFATRIWTIDFWIRMSTLNTNKNIFGSGDRSVNNDGGTIMTNNGYIFFNPSMQSADIAYCTVRLTVNTWTHVAIVANGTSYKGYINGVQCLNTPVIAITAPNYDPIIGAQWATGYGSINNTFNGYIEEFRISNIERWNSAFTPPTEQY